jgi:predicted phosphoribosyltransferase
MSTTYPDRTAAGEALATALMPYARRPDVLVLGLVRGGVPVAAAVARRLDVPLDVLVVRKLGVPWAPEVAFGALGPGGVHVFNDDIARRLDPADITNVVQREAVELARREQRYRSGRPPLQLTGRTAVIVDDGLATGATARVAVAVARQLGAVRVVAAAPVGSAEAVALLSGEADEVVCPFAPSGFGAVSRFYADFRQVDDDTVIRLLAGSRSPM